MDTESCGSYTGVDFYRVVSYRVMLISVNILFIFVLCIYGRHFYSNYTLHSVFAQTQVSLFIKTKDISINDLLRFRLRLYSSPSPYTKSGHLNLFR